jgi:regulatory protein
LSGSAAGNASRGAPPASSEERKGSRISPLQLAYRYLARRAYTERELEERLRHRGVPDNGIAVVLERLKRYGYLDDAATAAQWARSWRTYKGWGPMRVRAELGRRGLDRRLTEQVLVELFPDDETEAAAMQVAVRLISRPDFAKASASGGQGPVRWLAAHLARRGFPADLAFRVAGRCCRGGNDDMIDADG